MVSKIKIIAVGKVKDSNIRQGIDEFLKRLTPYVKIEIVELKDEDIKKESEKMLNYISNNTFLLDESGKEYTSLEFSEIIKKTDGEIVFMIGGAVGTSVELKQKARCFALSKMTFTHEMARLFLIEQIYRAKMIIAGKPYHK